jgi:hypothetical protein
MHCIASLSAGKQGWVESEEKGSIVREHDNARRSVPAERLGTLKEMKIM